MIWFQRVSRREFGEIFQAKRRVLGQAAEVEHLLDKRTDPDEIVLLWKHDPAVTGALPAACLVARERQQEFLAWATTYVPAVRPLTAFCHVIDSTIAQELLRIASPPTLGQLQDAVLGLILGETFTHLAGKRDLRSISAPMCFATMSYALARGVAIGIAPNFLGTLPDLWSRARFLANSPAVSFPVQRVVRVWSVLGMITANDRSLFNAPFARFPIWSSPSSVVLQACLEINRQGAVGGHLWGQLAQGMPEVLKLRDTLNGPKEERVHLLEAALANLRHREFDDEQASFFAAFLAGAISPGSLDHLELLLPLVAVFPDILLWYGLIAGLYPQTSVSAGSNGLGRKIIRELLREESVLDPPSCDISVTELEVLSKSARTISELRIGVASTGTVELFPTVNASYRFGRLDEGAASIPNTEMIGTILELEKQLDQACRTLDRLKQRLAVPDHEYTGSSKKPKRKDKGY